MTLAAHLAEADLRLAEGRRRRAGRLLGEALAGAFRREAHFDSTASPLASDPFRFVEPLRDSGTAREVRAARGRASRPAEVASPPLRLLVVTRRNATFLGGLLDHVRADERYDVRFLDLARHLELFENVRTPVGLAQELLTGQHQVAERVEAFMRPHLDWADTMFVEWCTAHAALLTLVDPGETRVINRLHSFEAFTPWPHFVDFSRLDDVLFVSEHLRDFAVDAIPGLAENTPRLHALPLSLDLQRFRRDKPSDARFTLGLVGWSTVAKDPLWALEALGELRRHDRRYRLLLVGDELDAEASAATKEYAAQLGPRLAELEAEGAVERTGQTDDVPTALERVGTILSSSVRESFHAGLVEGAASGAVAVVRDWPFFAGRATSARTLFPPDWVVSTPEQAAERVLGLTTDEATWRTAGAGASAYAIEQWDWSKVKHDYDRLLLGC